MKCSKLIIKYLDVIYSCFMSTEEKKLLVLALGREALALKSVEGSKEMPYILLFKFESFYKTIG